MKLSWKIWLLIFVAMGSLLVIFPLNFDKGVKISSVQENSSEYIQGLRPNQIIIQINNEKINSLEDYFNIINSNFPSDEKIKLIIETKEKEVILFTNQTPKLSVEEIKSTRIKTGLDLSGGARALVSTEEDLTRLELNDLIAVANERFNVYGLKDIQIRPVSDLEGKRYMLIEIAGSTPKELENLIAKQGIFEAKIGNKSVFKGGDKDITYVGRTGEQSGIYSCDDYNGQEICNFRFPISLSKKAAERHAEITSELGINSSNPQYLDKKLNLYLDGNLVSSLFISKDLQGSKTTQISISGSGIGSTNKEAYDNAIFEMKQLQTVLITGSLPFKLKIEKLETISPLLGEKFTNTILIAGLFAIVLVGIIIFLRYKKIKFSLAVLLTSLCEVLIILGISTLFQRNLDLPAIAGIIATIGTGVDSQIIILDESLMSEGFSFKRRLKRAFFIILGTYMTTFFALIPLLWIGAGLLKGFAITTIIGISAGVFITRPAFSEIVKRILKN